MKHKGKYIPTRTELEILKGYTYGMSREEIATSMDIPVEDIERCTGNLYDKWHGLENMWKEKHLRSRRAVAHAEEALYSEGVWSSYHELEM
jgi:hypothetical protein